MTSQGCYFTVLCALLGRSPPFRRSRRSRAASPTGPPFLTAASRSASDLSLRKAATVTSAIASAFLAGSGILIWPPFHPKRPPAERETPPTRHLTSPA